MSKKALIFSACLIACPFGSSLSAREGLAQAGGSFVTTSKSWRPSDYPALTGQVVGEHKAHAWRGERVNLQILLWTNGEAAKASVKSGPLTAPGATIPASRVRLDFLKFIRMNPKDGYASDPEAVEWVPDMLNGPEPVEMKAQSLQPLWVRVDIPRDAKPGLYKSSVKVSLGAKNLEFPYAIEVLPLVVPEVKDWHFDVNFWTHPQATAHYYSGCRCHGQDPAQWQHKDCAQVMWSERHLAWYRPTLELLRDAGLKTITVNLVKDPWRSSYMLKSEQAQTNYPYDEMIRWRRKADGTFAFDFSAFERYVKFCMSLGVDRRIECFSMLPWLQSECSGVSYFDEASGKEVLHRFKSWDEYDAAWSAFMREFVPVLVRNGWFEKTVIGADERGLGNMAHVQQVLARFPHNGKSLGISVAANRTHPFDDGLAAIAMHGGTRKVVNDQWTEPQFAKWAADRRAKGLRSYWYTCTGTYPGNFGNSRPAESAFIGWYSARLNADGYLRWAVDSWNDNPVETTDHKVYETGDTFQVYPGDRDARQPFTRSSVRLELLRQGVVANEKIRVLREKSPESAAALDAMLAKVERPQRPRQIPGQSSLVYEEETGSDFARMIEEAEKELLEISRNAIR